MSAKRVPACSFPFMLGGGADVASLMIVASRMELKRLLLTIIAVFVASHVASAWLKAITRLCSLVLAWLVRMPFSGP